MGTPDFARDILEKLHFSENYHIVAVYSQPDRPAGRGKKLSAPSVKVFALEHNYQVLQPLNFKDSQDVENLKSFEPDFLIVAAYGLILPQEVLDIPKIAPINIHASLLPKYRGAAPVQRAIMNMEEESGISIMKMEAGLDTGPLYSIKTYSLKNSNITSDALLKEFAVIGSFELMNVLNSFAQGENIIPKEQMESDSSYASKLVKNDGFIDWSQNAQAVHAQIRAVTSWPSPKVFFENTKLENAPCTLGVGRIGGKISDVAQLASGAQIPNPFEFWRLLDGNYAIATLDRWYILENIRPVGKREMSIKDFVNGNFSENTNSEFSFAGAKQSLSPFCKVLPLSHIKG